MPQEGILSIKGNKINLKGKPPPISYIENIDSITYEDFDITEHLPEIPLSRGSVRTQEKFKVHQRHLDTNIPYINGRNPTVDYPALRVVPYYLSEYLDDKIPKNINRKRFFENIIIPNQQKLKNDDIRIPDMDCLYYKSVSGSQHLFIRLSSETRKNAELIKKKYNDNTLYAGNGTIHIYGKNLKFDHANFNAKNIFCEAENTLYNRASKMVAQDTIRTKAKEQKNETVINKRVKEFRGSDYFTHIEEIESVDECVFAGKNVIQEGDKVENIGTLIVADKYKDGATHTSNMPAKATLYNHAWERDEGLFSSAETSVTRIDDVLIPSRYHVNSYKSESSKPGSSVKFGHTLIKANSDISMTKDKKIDVVVEERHTVKTVIKSSGFKIGEFGAKVPDANALLSKIERASSSGNMIGLTTAVLSTVSTGIKVVKNCHALGTAISKGNPAAILKSLAKFIDGPSLQFGTRSVDIRQSVTISHGNTFISPHQNYQCNESASFAGVYIGDEINIKTGTFITFDLPQTMEQEMKVHQTGINMDLLTFGLMLMAPETSGVMDAALGSISVSISYQENKVIQVQHKPTVIKANKLNIEANNGYLTQAQIKAGIVHAVFTNDLVLKSLANETFQRQKGGGASFGLGNFVGFESLATALKETALDTRVSSVDAGKFEKKIDEFASIVGEKEFYLKVGNILRKESAFIGHITHDQAHEHIEAKEIQNINVEEFSESWDNSYNFTIKEICDKIQGIMNNEFVHALIEDPENFIDTAMDILIEKCNIIIDGDIQDLLENPDKIPDAALHLLKKKYNEMVDEDIRALIEDPGNFPETLTELLKKKYNEMVDEDLQALIENPEKIPDALLELLEKKYNDIVDEDIKALIENPEKIPDTLLELLEKKYNDIVDEDLQALIENPEKIPDALTELLEKEYTKIIDEDVQELVKNPEKIPDALLEMLEKKYNEIVNEDIQELVNNPEKIPDALLELLEKEYNENVNKDIQELVENPEKIPDALLELVKKGYDKILNDEVQEFINNPEKFEEEILQLLENKYYHTIKRDIKELGEKLEKASEKEWSKLKMKYNDIFDEDIEVLIDNTEKATDKALKRLKEKYNDKIEKDIKIYINNPEKVPETSWKLFKEKLNDIMDEDIRAFINNPKESSERELNSLKEKYNDILDENILILLRYPEKVSKKAQRLLKNKFNEKIDKDIQTFIRNPDKIPERVWELLKEKYNERLDKDIQDFINSPKKAIEAKTESLKDKYIERPQNNIRKRLYKGKNEMKKLEKDYQKIANIQYRMNTELRKAGMELTEKFNIELQAKTLMKNTISKFNPKNIVDSSLKNIKANIKNSCTIQLPHLPIRI